MSTISVLATFMTGGMPHSSGSRVVARASFSSWLRGSMCPTGIAKLMSDGSSSAQGRTCAVFPRHTGAGLLFPDPEGLCASTTISLGRHEMPTWTEVTIDHTVCREEPLRLGRRLEPLH